MYRAGIVTSAGDGMGGQSPSGPSRFQGVACPGPLAPQVCGDAEAWGDFIVPVASAHLPGALQVDLEGAFHSPLGEKLPFLGPWYGSAPYLGQWLHHVTGGDAPAGGALPAQAAAAAGSV